MKVEFPIYKNNINKNNRDAKGSLTRLTLPLLPHLFTRVPAMRHTFRKSLMTKKLIFPDVKIKMSFYHPQTL